MINEKKDKLRERWQADTDAIEELVGTFKETI